MTLIAGFNLSDRIYLTSDTRVSIFNDYFADKPDSVQDNVQKVIPLGRNVIVSAAGSVKLASFLIKRLKKSTLVDFEVSEFKKKIKDWLAKNINEYYSSGKTFTTICLLFAGRDEKKQKILDGKKLVQYVGEFQKLREVPMQLKDVIFKGLNAKPNTPNPFPELPINNTSLFAIISDYKNGVFKFEDTEWGEYLAYGPDGFSKADVPKTMLGQLEFEQGCENPSKNAIILTAFIKSEAEIRKFTTVGGTVVPIMMHGAEGTIVITGRYHRLKLPIESNAKSEEVANLEMIGGKLYFTDDNGLTIPLIPFDEYPRVGGNYRL